MKRKPHRVKANRPQGKAGQVLALGAVSVLLISGIEAGTLVLRPPNPDAEYMFGYWFGDTVGIPDINGNGAGDLVVGGSVVTMEIEVGGEVLSGGVEQTHVFDGATGELLYTIISPLAFTEFSTFLNDFNVAGDVNQDGVEDLLAWAGSQSGGVLFFFDGRNGKRLFELKSPNPAGITGSFGMGAHKLDDVNGDGHVDWVVGEGRWGSGSAPRVYVFSGATRGLLWETSATQMSSTGPHGLPDLNGDGAGDIAIDHHEATVRGEGRPVSQGGYVSILSGVDGALIHELVAPDLEANDRFGLQIECPGDLDGDEVTDVLVGSQLAAGGGKVWIFSGATGEWIRTLILPDGVSGGGFGWEIEPLPDQTGDGVKELWILGGDGPRSHLFDGATGEYLRGIDSPVGGEFWITSTTDNGGETLGSLVFAQGKTGGNGRVYLESDRTWPICAQIQPCSQGVGVTYQGEVGAYVLEASSDLREWREIICFDPPEDYHTILPTEGPDHRFYRLRPVD